MKIKHAIFDMDGTLLDTNGVWVDTVFDYIENYCDFKRSDIPEVFEREIIFGGTYEALDYLRNVMGDNRDAFEIYDIIIKSAEEKYKRPIAEKPGATELLKRLKAAGADICVVTATPSRLAEKAFSTAGLSEYIDFIISGEERKSGKEKPYIFLEAAARMNCDISECTLFEDALYSLRTGKSLGMSLVAINDFFCTPSAWEEIKLFCDVCLKDYSELLLD